MRRVLLISLSLVLALVGWSTVGAEDGFYVIPGMKGKYAPVPKTGQTTSYGTRDDGALQKGVAWPTPRFTDNGNGTVTDNLTGLIWTKNANAFGQRTWAEALSDANGLASGSAGLTDGSKAGDWRLPNVRELQSLVDYGRSNPALPAGHPFTNVQSSILLVVDYQRRLPPPRLGRGFQRRRRVRLRQELHLLCVVCARRSMRLADWII